MKSFVTVMLVVLVSASLAAVACGEIVYVDRRAGTPSNDGVLEARGSDGAVTKTYDSTIPVYPEGIALSPDRSILYMALYDNTTTPQYQLRLYNVGTGALDATWDVADRTNGIAVDPDTGNIYCAGNTGYIVQFLPDGTRDSEWGTRVGVAGAKMADLEVYDGRLYGGGRDTGSKGVWSWDLSTGGTATLLGGTNSNLVEGLAFAPDGTLYTSKASEWNVNVWNSDYTVATELVNFIDGDVKRRPNEVDYFNGSLYVTLRQPDGDAVTPGEIRKVSDLTTTPTMVTFATASAPALQPRYVDVVPEPSALVLLATGLIGLMAYAWRKRK